MGKVINLSNQQVLDTPDEQPIENVKEQKPQKTYGSGPDEDIQTMFGKRLRQVVEGSGKTVNQIADELKISPPTIYRYMEGFKNPGMTSIVNLARYFGISIDWLLGVTGEKFEVYPPDVQEIASLYSCASDSDKAVIHAVLDKYATEK